MDRRLDSLSSEFRAKVDKILARLIERGVMVMIVQTSRTPEEHAANVAAGTSKTSYSKHLPRSLRGIGMESDKCDAIDLCPYDVYQVAGADKLAWNANKDPQTRAAWIAIGEEGEREGCRWGGRWLDPKDPGHLELMISGSDRLLAFNERQRPISV